MTNNPDLEALLVQRAQLKDQISHIGEMRPGSLVARFRKCGKPSCHCAQKGAKGHGPCYSLTHAVSGKTRTRVIPQGPAVDLARQQVEEYQRFRELVQQLVAVSEQICDLQLRQPVQPKEGVKKTSLDGLLAAEILWDIEALLGRQSLEQLDLEALESAVRHRALRLAAHAVQQRLNADQGDGQQPRRRCGCGQMARFAGRRRKTFQSALGPLTLERAYYHCSSCGQGFCPRDQHLGLAGSSLSPAVMRMVAAVGALVSFEEGSQLLQELAGIPVNAKQVERAAEALGVEIAGDEKRDVTPVAGQPLPPTLYLGVDGTAIPMRAEELRGRAGKQPDGSSKTREVKLCTVWSAEARDKKDRPMRDEGSVTYTAAIESAATLDTDEAPSAFTQRVLREASRRPFTAAQRSVVIGDGALWIWNMAQELFPNAFQIVDRFHVKQTLSTVAKALYGATSPNRPSSGLSGATTNSTPASSPPYCAPSAAIPPFPRKPGNVRNTSTATATA